MSGWTTHSGDAVALGRENIDTDQIIPARFMSTPRSEGYGQFLFNDLRRVDFPLMRHRGSSVLVTRRNFGCGSSREAAVYALVDFGIRVVIAPSFGDIFAGNAVNNGLLPARVEDHHAEALLAALGHRAEVARIDIARRRINLAGLTLGFELDAQWAVKLTNGWDDIDLTRDRAGEIAAYRADRLSQAGWAWPKAGHG